MKGRTTAGNTETSGFQKQENPANHKSRCVCTFTAGMAAFFDPMLEELLCSICLEVFNDPVSTPCGHNFCKTCLNTHWDNSQYYSCPICKETFEQRPDLRINIALRELVAHHKKTQEKQAEVVCDICDEGKLKAVKSCLVCQSSYCVTHLEPHLRVTGLQKHKLINPANNLQDYMCQNHERPLELFCRDDQTCVCLICTVTNHKYHNTVPLEESEMLEMMEEKEKAAEKHAEDLKQEITEQKRRNTELEMMIVEKQKATEKQYEDVIEHLKKEITELGRRNTELEMIVVDQRTAGKQYEDLIKNMEQVITDLKGTNIELEMMEEKQKATEEQYEDVIKDLKREITELRRRNIELEMIAERQKAAEKRHENLIKALEQETAGLKRRNTELEMMEKKQKTAEKQHQDVIKDLKTRNTELQVKISHTENNLRLIQEKHQQELRQQQRSSSCSCMCWLIVIFGQSLLLALFIEDYSIRLRREAEWKCMKQSAVDVTLDRDTAHPNLILSYDKKQVRYGDTALNLPDYSSRFDSYLNVMGKEGFSSGRFYFEVQVKGKNSWVVGVARESAKRKGDSTEWQLTPVNGFWTVAKYGHEYKARAGPDVSLSLGVKPQKVGVLVIYKVGLISFYDVDSRSHIYSFTGQTFTEKLYLVLNPCTNAEGVNPEPLIIAPVYYN